MTKTPGEVHSRPGSAARGRRPFGGVWRHPDFRNLWLAGAVSMVGTEVSGLAFPLTAALLLGAGPIGMGILTASRDAPSLLFGLFAGPWVDRLRRRPVLIWCDLARAAVLASIPLAWIAGLLNLAYLSLTAFLVGTFTVFFEIAKASYLPSVLRSDELVEGNRKIEVSESLTQFVGPGIGGVLIQVLSHPSPLRSTRFRSSGPPCSWVGSRPRRRTSTGRSRDPGSWPRHERACDLSLRIRCFGRSSDTQPRRSCV